VKLKLKFLVMVGVALTITTHVSGQNARDVRAWGITFSPDCSEQELRKQLAERKIELVPIDGQFRFSVQRGDAPIGEILFARGRVILAKQTWALSSDAGAISFAHGLLDAAKSIASRPGTKAEFGEDVQPDGSYRWANLMLDGKRITVQETDLVVDGRRVHLVRVDETVVPW
jgi:hypothetical protein